MRGFACRPPSEPFDIDPLSLLWLSLVYGVSKGSLGGRRAKPLIQELNQYDEALVVEYSIWALTEDRLGAFDDLNLYPQAIYEQPVNVQRWFFRLLTKSKDALNANLAT